MFFTHFDEITHNINVLTLQMDDTKMSKELRCTAWCHIHHLPQCDWASGPVWDGFWTCHWCHYSCTCYRISLHVYNGSHIVICPNNPNFDTYLLLLLRQVEPVCECDTETFGTKCCSNLQTCIVDVNAYIATYVKKKLNLQPIKLIKVWPTQSTIQVDLLEIF